MLELEGTPENLFGIIIILVKVERFLEPSKNLGINVGFPALVAQVCLR